MRLDEDALYIAIGNYFKIHDIWYSPEGVIRYGQDIDEDEYMEQFLGVLEEYQKVKGGTEVDLI